MAVQVKSPNGTVIYISGAPEYTLASDYIQEPPVDCTYIFANRCSIVQPIVQTREFHLHAAAITTISPNGAIVSAGTAGVPNITSLDKEADGSDAYPIWLSTAKYEKFNMPQINATGGDGSKGYSLSDHTVSAGAGGNGGNGANVTILANTSFDLIADEATRIVSDITRQPDDKIDEMLAWTQRAKTVSEPDAPDGVSWVFVMKIDQNQPDMDSSGPLPHAINAKTFLELMEKTVQELEFLSNEYLSAVDCSGGRGGHGGGMPDLRTTGPEGRDGKAGIIRRSRFSVTEIVNSDECLFHPDQVELTLRDIENSYYIGTSNSLLDAHSKLSVLIDRLSVLDTIKATDNLYVAYAKNEFAKLNVLPSGSDTPTSITSLKNSLKLARNYMTNLNLGLDFYRHVGTWVPRASYKSLSAELDTILQNFESVEENYLEYTKLADDQTQREDQIQKSKDAAQSGAILATANMTSIGQQLAETAGQIATLQDEVPRKCKAVTEEMNKLADRIKTTADMPSLKDFLSAASMIAFSPNEEVAAAQTAIQVGTMINGSATQIHDQAGNAVDKSYVVEKIYKLESGLEGLKEGLLLVPDDPNITVEDPGAAKLLGQEQDILDLVNQYSKVLGDDLSDFKKMFEDYINTVLQRNNQVIHYNTLITVYLESRNKRNTFKATKATLGMEEAKLLNSGIPAMTATVTSSYLSYTSQVMELLYDTQRALEFLSLTSGSMDLGSIQSAGFPSHGLGAALKMAKTNIIMELTNATENLSNGRQAYGTAAGLEGEAIRVYLSSWQLQALKMKLSKNSPEHFTTISVPYADLQSSIDDNPFAGNADVRVSNVRVYLEGAKTADNILRLTIQHMGDENMVTVYNEKRHFTHNRLVFAFEYNLKTGAVLVDKFVDGENSEYALPGPFATWRIGVSTLSNKQLDLSGVTKAWFEFSGYSRMFR